MLCVATLVTCQYCLLHVLDATIFLWDNTTEVLEGAGTALVEVCVILDGLPSGGLDCNITAELATVNITAGKRDLYI